MMRALVIEDDPALQVFYERVLGKTDFSVMIARDGSQALLALNSVDLPHLIILDVRLPDKNGIEVLNYLAEQDHLQHIPVVVASAGSEYEKMTQSFPSAQFLLKPVRPAQIIEITQQIADALKEQ